MRKAARASTAYQDSCHPPFIFFPSLFLLLPMSLSMKPPNTHTHTHTHTLTPFFLSHGQGEPNFGLHSCPLPPHCSVLRSFSSVQSLSCVRLFVTPWTAAHQASLSVTNSRSSLKLMSIESVMPSNHLILCRPLLLPPQSFSIRVFSNETGLRIRWPKYCAVEAKD